MLRTTVCACTLGMTLACLAAAGEPASPAAVEAPGTELTLREVCRRASSESDAVLAARLDAAAAYQRAEAAAAERKWPKLDLSEEFVRTDDPTAASNYRTLQNRSISLERDRIDNYRTRADLSYVVFDGGLLAGRQRAAEAAFSAEMRVSDSVRSRAIVAAGDAFFAAIYAERQKAVAGDEVTRMESRLELARKQEKAGRATEADVLLAEYHLERAKKDVLSAANSAASAREVLGRLLGQDTRVTAKLAEGGDSPLAAGVANVTAADSAEGAAMQESPELARHRAEQGARQAELEAQEASRWPRVAASASAYYDDGRFGRIDTNERSYLLGANVTWNVFDGGLRKARILEARGRAEAAEVRTRQAERQVRNQARDAARALEEARADVVVAKKKAAADQALCRQTETAHAAGRASLTELLRAQSDQEASRLAEIQAGFNERRASLRLLEITGYWASWQQ